MILSEKHSHLRPYVLLMFLFGVFLSTPAHTQCGLLPSVLEDRLAEGHLVIEGKVLQQNAFWGKDRTMIYTANQVEVYKIFKGRVQTDKVEVITIGGVIGDDMFQVTPSLNLEIGQTGVFVLKKYAGSKIDDDRKDLWVGVAENASFLAYDPKAQQVKDVFEETALPLDVFYERITRATGKDYIVQAELPRPQTATARVTPSITSFTPTTATAGTETLITITGTCFGATAGTVFFDGADDGAGGSFTGSAAYHIQTWTDTEITVWVPSGAGTGNIFVRDAGLTSSALSAQTLTVTYNIANVNSGGTLYRTFLIDDMCNSDGGYTFLYSTNTANSGVDFTTTSSGWAQAAFERALGNWHTDVGFAAFAGTLCGTTTVQTTGDDGTNVVGFDSDVWDLDVEASSSTLGVCYSQFSRCSGGTSSEWEVVGLDIIFRRDGDPNGMGGAVTWEFGGADGSVNPSFSESDFESVALHEIGHGHQLGHVISAGDVMHFSITNGTTNRTLGTDDIAGANDVETVSVAYSPPVFGGGCGGDFSCSRAYAVYNASNDCAIPLPVELVSFKGKLVDETVLLEWETASEINNDFFTLERSTDGLHFVPLAQIPGAGNSITAIRYDYLDKQPEIGINYYRLLQTDFDGTSEYSEIIAIEFESAIRVSVQPNPFTGERFELNYWSPTNDRTQVEIYSVTGQLIYQQAFGIQTGANILTITNADWPSGVYLIKTVQGEKTVVSRVLKE